MAIGSNPGGGTLSGTTSVTVVGGVATFGNLSINKAGNGYSLVASSAGLTSATSTGFNVTKAHGKPPRPNLLSGNDAALAISALPPLIGGSARSITIGPALSAAAFDHSDAVPSPGTHAFFAQETAALEPAERLLTPSNVDQLFAALGTDPAPDVDILGGSLT